MKTFINLTCPNCTAKLSVENDREFIFCQYCGTKLMLNDENTYTHRHIDEAEVRRVEAEQIIRLKELELEEKEFEQHQAQQKKKSKLCFIIGGFLFLLGIIGDSIDNFILSMCFIYGVAIFMIGLLGFSSGSPKKKKRAYGADAITITSDLADCYNEPYQIVEERLKKAGFTHIKHFPLKDLNIFHRSENGLTVGIIIDDEEDIEEGDVFSRSSTVEIMYHSMKDSLF